MRAFGCETQSYALRVGGCYPLCKGKNEIALLFVWNAFGSWVQCICLGYIWMPKRAGISNYSVILNSWFGISHYAARCTDIKRPRIVWLRPLELLPGQSKLPPDRDGVVAIAITDSGQTRKTETIRHWFRVGSVSSVQPCSLFSVPPFPFLSDHYSIAFEESKRLKQRGLCTTPLSITESLISTKLHQKTAKTGSLQTC